MRSLIFSFFLLGWYNSSLAQTEFEQERKLGETAAREVDNKWDWCINNLPKKW